MAGAEKWGSSEVSQAQILQVMTSFNLKAREGQGTDLARLVCGCVRFLFLAVPFWDLSSPTRD